MGSVSERLPLFPLGSVLFPGLALPLLVFEERYRTLMHDLMRRPEPERRFGVVLITQGHEVGPGAARELADVGCVADLRQLHRRDDGRLDVVAVGGERFRVDAVDDSLPYLQAEVTFLPERAGSEATTLAGGVNVLFRVYRELLRSLGGQIQELPEIPDEPLVLSYLVAASLVLDRREKQQLLRAESAADRLRLEVALLRRELSVLRVVPSLPAVETARTGVSWN